MGSNPASPTTLKYVSGQRTARTAPLVGNVNGKNAEGGKLSQHVEADDSGKLLTRISDRELMERDQNSAMLAELEELLMRQTDENREIPE